MDCFEFIWCFWGMAILWKHNLIVMNSSFSSPCYVGVNVCGKGKDYIFVNIYVSCNAALRNVLWSDLVERKRRSDGVEWCIGGDFNEVCIRKEG